MTFKDYAHFAKCSSSLTYMTFYFLSVVPFFIRHNAQVAILFYYFYSGLIEIKVSSSYNILANDHLFYFVYIYVETKLITKDRIYMSLHIVTRSMQLYESKQHGRFFQF